MPTTAKGIWTPDNTDDYDLVVDWAANANSVDAAISTYGNALKGTAAQRTAFTTTATNGMLWQDTDGARMIWRKDGAVWVPAVWRWGGTTAQMNAFTQAPDGFEWHNSSNDSGYLRQGGTWVRQDTPWMNVTLSGWTTQLSSPPQVRLFRGSVVFTGVISNNSYNGGFNQVGTLPSGIPAPSSGWAGATLTLNSTQEIKARVTTTGAIEIWRNGTSGGWASLTPLRYTP